MTMVWTSTQQQIAKSAIVVHQMCASGEDSKSSLQAGQKLPSSLEISGPPANGTTDAWRYLGDNQFARVCRRALARNSVCTLSLHPSATLSMMRSTTVRRLLEVVKSSREAASCRDKLTPSTCQRRKRYDGARTTFRRVPFQRLGSAAASNGHDHDGSTSSGEGAKIHEAYEL